MCDVRRLYSMALIVVLKFGALIDPVGAVEIGINTQQTRFSSSVIPWSVIRKRSLVRQGWDISCGAAALSTVLTYYHGEPVSETAITLTLLKNTDPELVRKRGGFSLLDLKRYVNAKGYEGRGYGSMSLEDIESFSIPAILPVRIRDFDHFVVYRGRVGGRILLGDPAFGNITLTITEFDDMWRSKIAFFVINEGMSKELESGQYASDLTQLSPQVMELGIPNMNYTQRVIKNIPLNPLVRRTSRLP